MIFSFKKLKQLASLGEEITIEDVNKAINSIGFEVEDFWKFNDIEGIKFAHVLDVYKNPNADKLSVVELEFADKKRIIQTNATNVRKDDYLIAFIPGARSKEMVFAPKEMKGFVSEGMLASLNELGFDKNNVWDSYKEGIFTFSKVDLNLDPMEYFDLDDYLIDIKILSNRSDANSYLIMARELAAYFKTSFKDIEFKKSNFVSNFVIENNLGLLSGIEAKNTNINLSIQDSLLIAKSGIKLISPVVDLTNLNLLMTGMPTHAYDKEKINSSIKADLFSGVFNILGDKEIEFTNALGIIDGKKQVISLAGVMGGENTGINLDTKEIIFEIGNFPIKEIRETLKQLKLDSNSGKQSSKKISIGTMKMGHAFLSNYLSNFSEPINLPKSDEVKIKFDLAFIDKMAGKEISQTSKFAEVIKSLEILGFKFEGDQIVAPDYRHDIENINDILEEVFRFYGYDNFEPKAPLLKTFINQPRNLVKPKIAAMGYQEVYTYSLISKLRNVFNPFDFKEKISLETFVSKEREEIRNSMAISLAEVIEYNQKRKIDDISIFEIGMINTVANVLVLASTNKKFNEIKQDLINVLPKNISFKRAEGEIFHQGVSAFIYQNDKKVGWIGKINPFLNISNAFFAEVLLDEIEEANISFNEYENAPLKSRDITFALELRESIGSIVSEIRKIKGIINIKIKDIFIHENQRKVTLNIISTDESLEELEKYNN